MKAALFFTLFLCGLGIGGNILCEAIPVCLPVFCRRCPPGWSPYRGRCYQFENRELDWADAEKFCNSFDGHLTSIQDTDQYDFIRDLIYRATGSNTKSWVGGTNVVRDDLWMWTDGTPFTFTAWGPGEPNNLGGNEHCMDINLNGRDYVNDENCSQENPFVCVKDQNGPFFPPIPKYEVSPPPG